MKNKNKAATQDSSSKSKSEKHYVLLTGAFAGLSETDIKQICTEEVEDIQWMDLYSRAVVTFKSEEDADKAYLQLQNRQIGGASLGACYIGEKNRNKFRPIATSLPPSFNLRALLVDDLPDGTTQQDLKKAFPKASKFELCLRNCYAEVFFDNENDAERAFLAAENMTIKGSLVTVVYASGDKKKQYTLFPGIEAINKKGKRSNDFKKIAQAGSGGISTGAKKLKVK